MIINPISTGGGGRVFSTPNLFFACKFFVVEPISPKFGNFSENLIPYQAFYGLEHYNLLEAETKSTNKVPYVAI